MTKRECITEIKKIQAEAAAEQLRRMETKEGRYAEAIHEGYDKARKVCAASGFVGKTFVALWEEAVAGQEREIKI